MHYFPIIYFLIFFFGLNVIFIKRLYIIKIFNYRSKLVKKFLYVGSIEEYEIIKNCWDLNSLIFLHPTNKLEVSITILLLALMD